MKKIIASILCVILSLSPFCAITESEVLCQLDDFSLNFIVMMTSMGKSDMMENMTVSNGVNGDQRIMQLSDQLACTVNLGESLDITSVSVVLFAPGGNADLATFFSVACAAAYSLYGEDGDTDNLSETLYNAMITNTKKSNIGVNYSTATLSDGVYALFAIYGLFGYANVSFSRTDRAETAETDANNIVMAVMDRFIQ